MTIVLQSICYFYLLNLLYLLGRLEAMEILRTGFASVIAPEDTTLQPVLLAAYCLGR